MVRVRQRLRLFVTVWLVFQAASFSALVPRDCCGAHRPAAKTCHEPPPVTHCPMQAADGTRCPMHRGHAENASHHANASHHGNADHRPNSPAPACRMSGGCGGPMAALFTLLSNHGILTDPTPVSPALDAEVVPLVASQNLAGKLLPPDAPPPRA